MNSFETNTFRIAVPDGWKAFKVNDRILQICKGGVLANDILRLPYLQLNFSGDAYMMPPSKDVYYDVTDIAPLALGTYTWKGFLCESMGFHVAMLWTGEGKRQFQVSANLETPLGKINMTDADVLEILASISTYDDAQTGVVPPHIVNNVRTSMGMAANMAASPLDTNGCKRCGAAFADPDAEFCHNCGAEREVE
ncbi:MAG: hypothetical protein IJN48_02320 [Clostridia bacterium]|nr:hypothetical protein [Clostridia bacterium]